MFSSPNNLIITLKPSDIKLDEVVVNAGYWEVKDRERTGNISRITSEDIQRQPVSNPLQSIQGRMPGVYIEQLSVVPGSNFIIRIRGTNSIEFLKQIMEIFHFILLMEYQLVQHLLSIYTIGRPPWRQNSPTS